MNYLGQIEQYVKEIDASQNVEDICLALRKHLEPQGFERFTYALLVSPKGPLQNPLYISTYPKGWAQRYENKRYASSDMVLRFVATSLRPFLWKEIADHRELTDAQKKIFNEATEFDIYGGCSVPIHGPGAAKASFSVASGMPENEFAALFIAQRHELHLVATYAHERMLQVGLKDEKTFTIKLTPRETEILTWAAYGKTAWETSEILSISEGTVRDHIKNACAKLDTNNKTHAIAVALLNGLIML